MNQTYTIACLSTALSPITHMARTEGNEAVIARQEIMTPTGRRAIPKLSGNALRHRLVRAPGGRFLIERYDLAGKLSLRQLNFLLHGGALTESNTRESLTRIYELHRIFPLYRLLGGSLPDAILPGSLICDAGVLVCRETRPILRGMTPAGFELPDNLRPAEAFVGDWQYTRGSAHNSAPDLTSIDEVDADGNLMIYAGQSVHPGAAFMHGFVAQHVSEMEIGALMLSLSLWQMNGATIGGNAAKGHGRLDTLIHCDPGIDVGAAMDTYIKHVDSVRDEAVAWLEQVFNSPAPKKGKKGAA